MYRTKSGTSGLYQGDSIQNISKLAVKELIINHKASYKLIFFQPLDISHIGILQGQEVKV